MNQTIKGDMDNGIIPADLREKFDNEKITLSKGATVSVKEDVRKWVIDDNQGKYLVRKEEDKLDINKRDVCKD
jgi:hypothetical protein